MIQLLITTDSGAEYVMTSDEAKELHAELSTMFGVVEYPVSGLIPNAFDELKEEVMSMPPIDADDTVELTPEAEAEEALNAEMEEACGSGDTVDPDAPDYDFLSEDSDYEAD